jgi:hypothetical protein
MSDCLFCDIVQGKAEATFVFGEHYFTKPPRSELEAAAKRICETMEQRSNQ